MTPRSWKPLASPRGGLVYIQVGGHPWHVQGAPVRLQGCNRNYNPSLFFGIAHVAKRPEASATARSAGLSAALCQCRTTLKPHQLTAFEFLQKNESSNNEAVSLWHHPSNAWIRSFLDQAGIKTPDNSNQPKCRGSILADNMGLGKTLKTLALVLSTADAAVEFQWADWVN